MLNVQQSHVPKVEPLDVNAEPIVFDAAARKRLLQIQLDGIYGHFSKASFISTLFALALVVYLSPVFGETKTHFWFALKAGVALGRFVLAQAYRSDLLKSRATLANRLMLISLALDGAVWGIAGLWAVHAPSAVVSLLIAGLCSVAMLATFGLQARLQATATFVVPMLVPTAIAMSFRGDALGVLGACGMFLIVLQTLVTSFASEKRQKLEFMAHEQTARALQARSEALEIASQSKAQLEQALEQLERQSAVKALFLGTMSHELRTPLHGILGLTELLKKEVKDQTSTHRLELLEASGFHLLDIISSLLDISRIDSGRLELHLAPYDLASEVRQLVDLYQLRCSSKGIGFRALVQISQTCWVLGDAPRVRQVLHNLLGNAVKFTERGLVQFRVRRLGGRAGRYLFEVADTGHGIESTDLPHIFEAFRQGGDTAARPSDGTGLGLTIARELAQAMGGDIVVTSARGVGSRFSFSADLPSADAQEIPIQRASSTKPRAELRPGYRVLVVEDNEVNAMIATAHLEQLGALVTRAFDGKEAVEAAFKGPRLDLILMDCRMPVMDGPAATREIRAAEKARGQPGVPIIALTATSSDEDKQECLHSGMNGFLTKPFSLDQLVQAIDGYAETSPERPNSEHPMYEFALSLDNMEPDLFGNSGGITMH
jgi:signal transduction histidine kinase/CheY-like chemotaxis protein